MDEEGVMLVLGLMWIATMVLWLRSAYLRRRAQRRLWSVVTQYELPAELLQHDLDVLPVASTQPTPRLEQLEGQVDLIAQQLDRLAESQEFLARLMTQHGPKHSVEQPKVVTPH